MKIIILFEFFYYRFVLRIHASGIVALYKLRHLPSTNQCGTDNPPETKIGALDFVDLVAAFFILGVGMLLSVLAFIAEILAGCYHKDPFDGMHHVRG